MTGKYGDEGDKLIFKILRERDVSADSRNVTSMLWGSGAPLADAEVVNAAVDALDAVGVRDFRVLVNSRRALAGLLEVYGVPTDKGHF